MNEYRVMWCIDILADSPHAAAELAERLYMKTQGARVYEVSEWEPLSKGNGATLSETIEHVDLDQ